MITTISLIYFSGYIASYFCWRACERHNSKRWTKKDRLQALGGSFLSWFMVLFAIGYFFTYIISEKFGGNEKAKW